MSILHGRRDDGSKSPSTLDSMKTKDPLAQTIIGQREKMSESDVVQLNNLLCPQKESTTETPTAATLTTTTTTTTPKPTTTTTTTKTPKPTTRTTGTTPKPTTTTTTTTAITKITSITPTSTTEAYSKGKLLLGKQIFTGH